MIFSVLDLSPIIAGGTAAAALRNTLDLARHAETWGYQRYWLAEHHNMTGIASAATAVVIGHVAAGTSSIRVGAGGIMLPNHAPLVIAEQFGTLGTLFPGRIDLGLGRAPGTDRPATLALRGTLADDEKAFPDRVLELMAYFRPAAPGQAVQAVPGAGVPVPLWILGSSLYGAQLAAAFGLPFAFASHFAPAHLEQAVGLYRARFRPSPECERPRVMLAVNIFAADSDAEARLLFSSVQQAFVNLRRGQPGPLPAPDPGFEGTLDAATRGMLAEALSCSFVGTPETVRAGLAAFVSRHAPDEIIVAAHIYDHAARLRSYDLTAREVKDRLAPGG